MEGKLAKLCRGAAAIAPGIEIHFKPSEIEVGKWSVILSVNDAILVYTEYAPLDDALDLALRKLAAISTRMMAAVRRKSEPPAGGDGGAAGGDDGAAGGDGGDPT